MGVLVGLWFFGVFLVGFGGFFVFVGLVCVWFFFCLFVVFFFFCCCCLFSFLNTRRELKVSGLTGERLAVHDGSTGVSQQLKAVWVCSELRVWKIEVAQDFQAFSS